MTLKTRVRYDQRDDPAMVAADLIERSGQFFPPINLERVAALWPGVRISRENIDNEGYIIDLGIQGAEILVKATDSPARQRFTVAHELGHWILANGGRASGQPPRVSVQSFASKERWCDRFAVHLLMPAAWITEQLGSRSADAVVERILRGHLVYGVSPLAFRLRVSELTAISIYELVVSRRGVSVARRYESPLVSKPALSSGLRLVVTGLLKGEERNATINVTKELVALQKVARRTGDAESRWLVCILPRSWRLFSRR